MGLEQLTPAQRAMKMKPTAAAKLLDMKPQPVYGWIKQGAPHYDSAIGPMVIIDELVAWRGSKGIPSGTANPSSDEPGGSARRTAPKTQLTPEQQIKFEKVRIERQKGVYDTTFWLPGYRPQPLEFDSIYPPVAEGTVQLKSVTGVLQMCSINLQLNGADHELVKMLDVAVEELVKAGYNQDRATASEPSSTSEPEQLEGEDDDGLSLGQEEAGDGLGPSGG